MWTRAGAFLYWEQMSDGRDGESEAGPGAAPVGRALVPSGKAMRLDDVFGEVRRQRVRACWAAFGTDIPRRRRNMPRTFFSAPLFFAAGGADGAAAAGRDG